MSEKLSFVAELKRRNVYTHGLRRRKHCSFKFADTLSMETIAGECGFGNVNSMRTVFQRALKIAPDSIVATSAVRIARNADEAEGDNASPSG